MHSSLLILKVLIHLWLSAVATSCQNGRFGANCSGVCHCALGPAVCNLTDGSCKEGLCRPGWIYLPLCQTECSKGFFGMNCSSTCHCNTMEECSAINGHCASNECASGWTGRACQIRIPVLSRPPVVTSKDHRQVTLVWPAYLNSLDNISISSYEVQMCNKTNETDWTDVDSVSVSSGVDKFNITIPNLDLIEKYKFRVTIVWLHSNKSINQMPIPGPSTQWFSICQEPSGKPTSLTARIFNSQTDKIKISWQGPDRDSGCERYDFLMIHLTCPGCEAASKKVVLPSSFTTVIVSRRNRTGSPLVNVKVQAFNNAGLVSRSISTAFVRLPPIAPSDLEDNSSVPTYNKEISLDTSDVAAIEDTSASTISTDVSVISKDVVSTAAVVGGTGEYVTEAPVVTTDVAVNATNVTELEQKEIVFDAASGAVDVGAHEASSSLANDMGHLSNVIPAPNSRLTSTPGQQKSYQLLKRSQNMMSFRAQASDDSIGVDLQVTVKESDSLYPVVSSDRPVSTVDSSRSIVISNLRAGTLYQVDVYKIILQSTKTVLVFSASHWTLMLSPPKLSPPQVMDIQNTSITLKANLPRLAKRANGGTAHGILVVVEPDMNIGSRFRALTESSDVLVHDAVAVGSKDKPLQGYRGRGSAPYYVALAVEDPPVDGLLVIGDDRIYGLQGEYHNVPLMPLTRYWLWVGLTSSLDGVVQLALTPLESPIRTGSAGALPPLLMEWSDDDYGDDEGLSAGSIAAIILAVILIILIVCLIFIWWYKYKEVTADPPPMAITTPTYRPSKELTDKKLDVVFEEVREPVPIAKVEPEVKKTQQNTFDASFYVMKVNHPVAVAKLRHHYETHLRPNAHYALQDEFRRLPDGFTDTTNVANLPYNVSLNRSQAVTPYDKNRVKLARQYPNDSTYINASYIRTIGYRSCIVTQCPTASTVNEFWRMVWEMQVGTIVMLIESRESNGTEYYHYWPRKSKPIYYRDVKVQLMREDKLAHHEVREFRLSCTSEKVEVRRVIQWQYVQWKPGGIPDHPIPFLNMVAAIQEEHDPESGFVIHCLKGGGRSGIYAAVDALVNEGRQTGKVDVLECVTLLRLERINLVKSLKQYRFVYHCLIEAFNCHETRTPVHRFHFMLANLLARNELDCLTRFEKEFCAVQLECYAVRPCQLAAASRGARSLGVGTRYSSPDQKELEDREGTKRFSDSTRYYGLPPPDYSATPCNVLLDGCFTKDAFILSSAPDKSNLDGFWEMINEHEASCVVMLNKAEDLPFADCFLPDDGSSVNCGRYTVYCDSVLIHPNSSFYVHNLNIVPNNNCNNANAVSSLRLYEFTKWPTSLEVPLIDAVLDLTINVSDWNRRVGGGRPAVMFSIHGGDKARASLFSVIWMMIDPIQHDGVVDVYSAARYVYSYMPTAVTSVEQYHFLYRVMEEHVIRIETQKWRPEKMSDSFLPSSLLKTYTSDGNGEEDGSRSKSPCKPGKRRKRVKRLCSDASASLSLKKRRSCSKRVRMVGNVAHADSTTDGCDQDVADRRRKLRTGADCRRFSKDADDANKRWQSPDKTGKWCYPDVNRESQTLCDKTPKDALIDVSKCGLHVSDSIPQGEKKCEADDRKKCLAKCLETPVKQEKPEVKPVAPTAVKYETTDALQLCLLSRNLRDQPVVTPPALKPEPPPVKPMRADVYGRQAKVTQRQPSHTGTSSDEVSPASKKLPLSSPCRMTCKCNVTSGTGSPSRRMQCRCKVQHDSASIHSAHSDNSDRLRPGARVKSLTNAQKERRGLSPGREKLGLPRTGKSSSDEGSVAAARRRRHSPKRPTSKQSSGVVSKKSSSLERRTQRKSPSRVGKSPRRFDENKRRPVSPSKKPSSPAYNNVPSRTRYSDEKIYRRHPARKERYVNAAQRAEVVCPTTCKEQNFAYTCETRSRPQDQCPDKCDEKRLQKPTGKPVSSGGNSRSLSPAGRKSPAAYTSSMSDDMDDFSPKLKSQKKTAPRSPADEERARRRCRSPGRSSSQEDRYARASPHLKDEDTKVPRIRKEVPQTPSSEEKPQRLSPTRPKISPTQDPLSARQRRRIPTLSKEGEISRPKSQGTPEKRGKISPIYVSSSPKRSLSPARSSGRGGRSPRRRSPRHKSPRHLTSDQKRSRRSPSRGAASPKRSRLSSRSSSRERSSLGEKSVESINRREASDNRVVRPAARPVQGRARETSNKDPMNSTKMSPPQVGRTFSASATSSIEADVNISSSTQVLSTKPDKPRVTSEDKVSIKSEISQQQPQPPPPRQIARSKPSNVGCEIEQQIMDGDTPSATRSIARSRAVEERNVRDEVRSTANYSLSDLSIDTRLTFERAQARLEQKDVKMQIVKPEAKPQAASKELRDAKEVLQTVANQNRPKSTIPAARAADVPPPKVTTAPCSKSSAKAPVEENLSFDYLMDGLFYIPSVASNKSNPSTDAIRQQCPDRPRSGQSKTIDSSLSPEGHAGIHSASASPRSDASLPKPGATRSPCSCANPEASKGFHPKDTDIPFIDDTEAAPVHLWRAK